MLLELFGTFFYIGLFTIGGGYAMIPMIQDLVVGKGWLLLEELVDFIAVSEATPGPFAVNIATFVGNHLGGPAAGLAATLGVILPSFIIILLVARVYDAFKENVYVQRVLYGLRPAVVGLIAAATLSVAGSVFWPQEGVQVVSLGILAMLVALRSTIKKIHPIAMIGLAALLGLAAGAMGF